MAEADIEDLEELYRRFAETDYGYIPVPGLHRGKVVSFKEFKRHTSAEAPLLYGGLVVGLCEALGIDPRGEEGAALALAYICGQQAQAAAPTVRG